MMKDLFAIKLPAVSPSLLAADQMNLPSEIELALSSGAELIHFDVMDGRFVPATSFWNGELDSVLPSCPLFRDVHLMVEDPIPAARKFADLGADCLTLHLEALEERGVAPNQLRTLLPSTYLGISLRPHTPVERLKPYLPYVDLVLLMSVEPGKGGQAFLEASPERAAAVKGIIKEGGYRVLLSIDGGINGATAKKALASGVDILVAGSYLYGHSDFASRLRGLIDG